jgi:acetyl esterase/lipase
MEREMAVKMKILCAAFLLLAVVAHAQVKEEPKYVADPQVIPLWEHGAPGALGHEDSDRPTLTLYEPLYASKTGTAVIVAPGGGYGFLAMNHEGRQVANWLNAHGITAFVLKYRLGPRYHHPIELGDAQRAIRLVRSRAAEFHLKPDHIGMMGFSAGGHLASSAGTHFDEGNPAASDPIDRASCRPDFLVLGYPVITFVAPYAEKGSRKNLLGENPDPKLERELSSELQVTAKTPPTFLFSTTADTVVPVENTIDFYLALKKAGVPAEMHVFQNGPHGVGLAMDNPALTEWTVLLANWLRENGFMGK